ncbi:MAG: prepilin peptidase [Candidatus Bathyarchaeota archaeon]|nr:prepilin peptidase [Candidatus Bathyarchaeota archaeon]
MQTILIFAKIILSLAFLIFASWSDYKTREVTNRVWKFYAPIALFLSFSELFLYEFSKLPLFGLSFGITFFFAITLFYSGGFGGADSKALICIALALPFSTEKLFTPLLTSEISPLSQNLFPITIFSNSVLFAAVSGLYMLMRNTIKRVTTRKKLFEGSLTNESIWKKILVLITGYKVPIAKLEEKWHVYPMEDIGINEENQPKRKLIIVPKDERRNEIVERLSKAVHTRKIGDQIWVTPGLPMLIFITLGLVVAILFGDLVWILISMILG